MAKPKKMSAKSEAKMKEQLETQLRNAEARDKAHQEKAATLSLPCARCGAELDAQNRSILQDGTVVHIGCPRKPRDPPKRKPVPQGVPHVPGMRVPEAPKGFVPDPKHGDMCVMIDFNGRTCLQLKRDIATVTYVPMDVEGLHLTYEPMARFDARFKTFEVDAEINNEHARRYASRIQDEGRRAKHLKENIKDPKTVRYDLVKAVEHYKQCAMQYGATQDVLDWLGRVVKLTTEEKDMAKKKLADKVQSGKASGKPKGPKGERKETAASMFQTLIMAGGKTDDQIFAVVKAKFGLDDKKRGYVAWYRNHLKKAGKNPPEPKGGAAKEKPAKKGKGKKAA